VYGGDSGYEIKGREREEEKEKKGREKRRKVKKNKLGERKESGGRED
jgi:hypothetical protein